MTTENFDPKAFLAAVVDAATLAVRSDNESLEEYVGDLIWLLRGIRGDEQCAHWHEDIDAVAGLRLLVEADEPQGWGSK